MSLSVLIAEDDPGWAEYLERTVSELFPSFRLDVVNDGEAMSFALKKTTYELLLVDYFMPGKDGLEALRDLRQGAENYLTPKDVPAIFFTGYGNQRLFDEAAAAGVAEIIEKKDDIRVELSRALNTALSSAKEDVVEKHLVGALLNITNSKTLALALVDLVGEPLLVTNALKHLNLDEKKLGEMAVEAVAEDSPGYVVMGERKFLAERIGTKDHYSAVVLVQLLDHK